MSGAAAAAGAVAAARWEIYDPFFGNTGETVAAAPDGRVYTSINVGAPPLVRKAAAATCPSAANAVFTIDPAPQFSADVDITMNFNTGTPAANNRIYARFTNINSCYFLDWSIATGIIQIGYRDSGGAHTLNQSSLAGSPNTNHVLRFRCQGTTLTGWIDGFNLVNWVDSRYAAGQVGFQFFNLAQFIDTFQAFPA